MRRNNNHIEKTIEALLKSEGIVKNPSFIRKIINIIKDIPHQITIFRQRCSKNY